MANSFKSATGHFTEVGHLTGVRLHISCTISNTRDSVSSGYPNTETRVKNITRSGRNSRCFRIAHETLSRVFDIPSQSKQKLRSKRRRDRSLFPGGGGGGSLFFELHFGVGYFLKNITEGRAIFLRLQVFTPRF